MHRIVMTMALTLTPALLMAQASAKGEATASSRAGVQGSAVRANAGVDAEVAVAREKGLPTQAIKRRAAEGRAKGASEAQVALAARRVRMNLEAAHEAMVRAGRAKPSHEETEGGAMAIERGYTRAQIEAVAKSAPSDRSLVVAFDVLTRLVARGVASEKALAQVRSRLEARASDAEISGMASANAGLGVGVGAGSGSAAAGARTGVSATAGATKGATSVTGGITGTVGGVIKKP